MAGEETEIGQGFGVKKGERGLTGEEVRKGQGLGGKVRERNGREG